MVRQACRLARCPEQGRAVGLGSRRVLRAGAGAGAASHEACMRAFRAGSTTKARRGVRGGATLPPHTCGGHQHSVPMGLHNAQQAVPRDYVVGVHNVPAVWHHGPELPRESRAPQARPAHRVQLHLRPSGTSRGADAGEAEPLAQYKGRAPTGQPARDLCETCAPWHPPSSCCLSRSSSWRCRACLDSGRRASLRPQVLDDVPGSHGGQRRPQAVPRQQHPPPAAPAALAPISTGARGTGASSRGTGTGPCSSGTSSTGTSSTGTGSGAR